MTTRTKDPPKARESLATCRLISEDAAAETETWPRGSVRRDSSEEEAADAEVTEEETVTVRGTRSAEPTAGTTDREEEEAAEAGEASVEAEDGEIGETVGTVEATSQPTTGGRMTDLTIATMAAAEIAAMEDAAEDAVMMGVAVIAAEEEETDTPRIGPSLFPETRGWKRSSSTKATAHPGSTLKGKLKLLESLSHLSLSH